ncbi:MAG: GNAT family N-acetyltransferase [Oscillospiraceae bacterium]|nr:GNAT family N-acetyltransferase [Oscillospiraceae bacterium]
MATGFHVISLLCLERSGKEWSKQMDQIKLIRVSAKYAEKIWEYRAEFPADQMRVTYDPARIPGMDYLEKYNDGLKYENVLDWLTFCEDMSDKLTWYMSIRENDGKIVGFILFRHKLEYDDDEKEFASNFGYSIRPSERGKGYAKEQLRLGLQKAKAFGLDRVRIVCRDRNIGSNKTILANGGLYVDTILGSESGLDINRYDIPIV